MTKSTDHPKQRIDEYIHGAPTFARAICRKLREIILTAEPGIIEAWKWGPNYSKNGMVCGFATFKRHVSLAFFRGVLMKDPKCLFIREEIPAKSMRRVRFTSVEEIDEEGLTAYIKEAVALNMIDTRVQVQTLSVPKDLKQVLAKSAKVKEYFDSLSYTHKKEYIRWIESAKRAETRLARLKKACAMLSKKVKHP